MGDTEALWKLSLQYNEVFLNYLSLSRKIKWTSVIVMSVLIIGMTEETVCSQILSWKKGVYRKDGICREIVFHLLGLILIFLFGHWSFLNPLIPFFETPKTRLLSEIYCFAHCTFSSSIGVKKKLKYDFFKDWKTFSSACVQNIRISFS